MDIQILDRPFDPLEALRRHQDRMQTGQFGATAVFIGTMRDVNEGDPVKAMRLEHYPTMTEQHLRRISEEAMQRWDIMDTLIVHRVGHLEPADPIVLVAAWSAHRSEAFAACRYLIEELKSRAPFWKKETLDTGERWVDHNTPG